MVLSLKNANLIYLLPIWGNEPTGMINGVLTIASLFQPAFVLTMIIPFMRRPEKAMKASFWGMFIAGGLYLTHVIAAVGVFGPEETKHLLWPTLELAKTTTLPGNILERIDAAYLAIWVTAVFTTLFSTYYLTIHVISKLFRLRDHKFLSFFVLPYLFGMAMLPQNVLQMYKVIEFVGQIGLCITIAYPFVLLIVAILRKKEGIPFRITTWSSHNKGFTPNFQTKQRPRQQRAAGARGRLYEKGVEFYYRIDSLRLHDGHISFTLQLYRSIQA